MHFELRQTKIRYIVHSLAQEHIVRVCKHVSERMFPSIVSFFCSENSNHNTLLPLAIVGIEETYCRTTIFGIAWFSLFYERNVSSLHP